MMMLVVVEMIMILHAFMQLLNQAGGGMIMIIHGPRQGLQCLRHGNVTRGWCGTPGLEPKNRAEERERTGTTEVGIGRGGRVGGSRQGKERGKAGNGREGNNDMIIIISEFVILCLDFVLY